MAPISGFITVTFIANYPTNDLYWREGCTGPYTGPITIDCTPPFGAFVPGSACSYTIPTISFENESCDEVCYDGYIEATCNEEGVAGQLAWTKNFVPVPECTAYDFVCNGTSIVGLIESVIVDDPGEYLITPTGSAGQCVLSNLSTGPNHLPGTTLCGTYDGKALASSCSSNAPLYCQCVYKPIITISNPPSGTVASLEAVMGFGGLTLDAIILQVGTGPVGLNATYYNVPCDTASNYIPLGGSLPPLQGIGIQTFTITIVNGELAKATPNLYPNQGKWFYIDEYFTFDSALIGGVVGTLCKPATNSIDLGDVIAVEVISPGSGYVAFPPPILSLTDLECDSTWYTNPADLTAIVGDTTVGDCPPFDPGANCEGANYAGNGGVIPALPPGSEFTLCYIDGIPPTVPSSYTVTTSPECCYDCISVIIQANGFDPLPTIIYTDCTTNTIQIYQMTNYLDILACVLNNSWYSSESSTIFTPNGACIS